LKKKLDSMQVHVIRPSELDQTQIAAWHSMQLATPSLANPFLSPELAVVVENFRPGTQVAVLTEGHSIIGFFPFERRRFGVGVPICGWLSPCQGVVHALGARWDPRELLRGCRLSSWQFDNLVVGQQSFQPYHAATAPSPVIDLADGFSAYCEKLHAKSPHLYRELGRKTRKLGREVGEVRLVADSGDAEMLRTFMEWKSDQYRRNDHVDRFERPWIAGLLDALLTTKSQHLTGLLSVLYAGDQPVAAQFGLRAGHLLVGWFIAYDNRFGKYSPGLIQIMQMTEALAASGVTAIHMGKGAKSYTENIKSDDIFVAEGVVTARSALGATHHVRGAATRWAVRTVRMHPGLHDVADQILRRSGVSRRTYGRI